MMGARPPVEGCCNATLEIADDWGDNVATMRCERESGHPGSHLEVFFEGRARLEWRDDDRKGGE